MFFINNLSIKGQENDNDENIDKYYAGSLEEELRSSNIRLQTSTQDLLQQLYRTIYKIICFKTIVRKGNNLTIRVSYNNE